MRLNTILISSVVALVCAANPVKLFGDQYCGVDPAPSYQNCGVALGTATFRVEDLGLGVPLIFGIWGPKGTGDFNPPYANFTDYTYIHAFPFGSYGDYVGTDWISYSNQNRTEGDTVLLNDPSKITYGQTLELVLRVVDDPNHKSGVDYCWGLNTCEDKTTGHVWAVPLPANQCIENTGYDCVFVGFEDITQSENGDFDYNDFEFYLYGVQLCANQECTSVISAEGNVPEPSTILLLAGTPLAIAIRTLCQLCKF